MTLTKPRHDPDITLTWPWNDPNMTLTWPWHDPDMTLTWSRHDLFTVMMINAEKWLKNMKSGNTTTIQQRQTQELEMTTSSKNCFRLLISPKWLVIYWSYTKNFLLETLIPKLVIIVKYHASTMYPGPWNSHTETPKSPPDIELRTTILEFKGAIL